MQAVVKAPHTKFSIEGSIPKWLIDILKEKYAKKLSIIQDDEQLVDITETDWYKEISKKTTPGFALKTYRTNHKLTQAQLAKKIKETPQHISDMENNRRAISKKIAVTFSKLFHTSVSHFIMQ